VLGEFRRKNMNHELLLLFQSTPWLWRSWWCETDHCWGWGVHPPLACLFLSIQPPGPLLTSTVLMLPTNWCDCCCCWWWWCRCCCRVNAMTSLTGLTSTWCDVTAVARQAASHSVNSTRQKLFGVLVVLLRNTPTDRPTGSQMYCPYREFASLVLCWAKI
jgi:hypothetical protein